MKNRLIQLFVFIAVFSVLILSCNSQNNKYEIEKTYKTKNVFIMKAPIEIIEHQLKQNIIDENENKLKEKMQDINEKYEIIENLVPTDYEQLNTLDQEIKKLNETINTNTRAISKEEDINLDTLQNLEEVSNALDTIIDVFTPSDEENIVE